MTCHVTNFKRGLIDRLQDRNWFEEPSSSSISCRQTGVIVLGDIDRSDKRESVFSQHRSIILKTLSVIRLALNLAGVKGLIAATGYLRRNRANPSVKTLLNCLESIKGGPGAVLRCECRENGKSHATDRSSATNSSLHTVCMIFAPPRTSRFYPRPSPNSVNRIVPWVQHPPRSY